MRDSHYAALLLAYSVALAGALGMARLLPGLWPPRADPSFTHPWRELGWALVAAVAVLGIGVLYSQGWLLPATSRQRPLLDAVNQLLIYAPFPLLLTLRRQPLKTAWLPEESILLRISIGIVLALLALGGYAAARSTLEEWPSLVAQVYSPQHVSYFVQVLLEDLSIAILFVRLQGVLGRWWALLLVAVLFAAAHIPGLLARGADLSGLSHLFGDVALGVLVLSVLRRLQDVWWFWMVHFALDMTQFYRPTVVA